MTIPFNTIKGLLFDKDGTLFDFQQSWSDWCHRFIHSVAKDAERRVALGSTLGFDLERRTFLPESAVIAGTPEDTVNAVASVFPELDQNAVRELIVTSSAEDFQVPVAPLPELFEQLQSFGLKLGIATNDAEVPARAHLSQFALTSFFDFIAGYDSGYGAKPSPGQMNGFLAQFGMAPREAIMIGDSTHDLEAGRAANMYTIGVLTGVAPDHVLAPYADLILPDISALPALFAR